MCWGYSVVLWVCVVLVCLVIFLLCWWSFGIFEYVFQWWGMFEYIFLSFGLFLYALQPAGRTSASCMGACFEEYLVIRLGSANSSPNVKLKELWHQLANIKKSHQNMCFITKHGSRKYCARISVPGLQKEMENWS